MTGRRVTLGRVSGVFGVKGWIKVYSYTRPAANILRYRKWWIVTEAGREAYRAEVVAGQQQGPALVAQISDAAGQPIDDRDRAAALIGASIEVERDELPKLREGEFYWIDASAPALAGAFPAYRRLAVALDVGSAIKGEIRADLYIGRGEAAGREAGRVRHALRMYRLAPRS